MCLQINIQSLNRTRLGTISGQVWFAFEGKKAFPEDGWTDILIPVVKAWIESLYRLREGRANSESVFFMEGPFRIDLFLFPGVDLVTIHFVRRGDADALVESATGSLRELLTSATKTAKLIINQCKKLGWSNDDIVELEQLLTCMPGI